MTSRSRKRREVQGDIFDAGISAAKKDAALDEHESRKGFALAAVRKHLEAVYQVRRNGEGDAAFVTADDAVRFVQHNPALKLAPGPWMGALFKAPGWRFTGKWVASVRASNNGRMNRCWRYDGNG